MNIVYWTTKDNRKINIDEMSVDHLRNIVKMIVKQSQDFQNTCPHNVDDAMSLEREEGESFFEKLRSTKYEDISWRELEF
jgi:hypothetical protein